MSKHVKHYVEFIFLGIIASESEIKEIQERNSQKVKLPENSFGFRFFDRTIMTVDGEKLKGERKNISGWFYEGIKLSLEQVKKEYSTHTNLIHNMEVNGLNYVVLTKFNQFIPFREMDAII